MRCSTADQKDPDSARRALEVFGCRLGQPAEPVRLRLQSKAERLRIEGAEPPPKAAPTASGLKAQIITATTEAGGWLDQSELARSLGRAPSEGSLRNDSRCSKPVASSRTDTGAANADGGSRSPTPAN